MQSSSFSQNAQQPTAAGGLITRQFGEREDQFAPRPALELVGRLAEAPYTIWMSTTETKRLSPAGPGPQALGLCQGILHVYVAFDWGDEVRLAEANRLIPAEKQALARRRRTPPSFEYRPLPLRLNFNPVPLELPELGQISPVGEATIFDFGAVSVSLDIPFQLPASSLSKLTSYLATPESLVKAIRHSVEPLYHRLLPAIDDPFWSEMTEEYFVIEMRPGGALPALDLLFKSHAAWLASLVRLDADALSPEEVAEAIRLRIGYTADDLFVADWPAAVLIDRDCEETLQVVEFANVQLLEYRHIDTRLDNSLSTAYRLIHGLSRSRMPFWRTHARSLRVLGDLKLEATDLFERTGNVLKLVGDQYLARVYRVLAGRFHIEEWEKGIRRKLEVLEGIYQTLSDQAATFRAELLEGMILLLIIMELVLAFYHH
jgi:hypothetical protein